MLFWIPILCIVADTLNAENVALIKSRAKFCGTYATFSSRNFFFILVPPSMRTIFLEFFVLDDIFQPGAPETLLSGE